MRNLILILVLVITNFSCVAQNRKFLIHFNGSDNFQHAVRSPGNIRLAMDSFDEAAICGGTIDKINSELARKNRQVLMQDSILNRLSESTVETFSKSRFLSASKLKKERASIEYALGMSASKNRMISTYCFRVDLLDLILGAKFYCNRREHESELHLYAGDPPKIRNKEHPDYIAPIPLKSKTIIQTVEQVMATFSSKGGMREVFSKRYTQIGLACRLDQRTLNQSKRPTMYFTLMLAGKQTQNIKKKDITARILAYLE
jgi:hypothetical protein